jgi:hypothetical protein
MKYQKPEVAVQAPATVVIEGSINKATSQFFDGPPLVQATQTAYEADE